MQTQTSAAATSFIAQVTGAAKAVQPAKGTATKVAGGKAAPAKQPVKTGSKADLTTNLDSPAKAVDHSASNARIAKVLAEDAAVNPTPKAGKGLAKAKAAAKAPGAVVVTPVPPSPLSKAAATPAATKPVAKAATAPAAAVAAKVLAASKVAPVVVAAATKGGTSPYAAQYVTLLVQPAASGLRPTSNRFARLAAVAKVAEQGGTIAQAYAMVLNGAGLRVRGHDVAGMLARGHIALSATKPVANVKAPAATKPAKAPKGKAATK